MKNCQNIYFRCDDNAEMVVFNKYNWDDGTIDYEFTIEDSYCGGDYMGIKGRFKRAWSAFWKKPICYTGVYSQDAERMKKFLNDCLALMKEQNDNIKTERLTDDKIGKDMDFCGELCQFAENINVFSKLAAENLINSQQAEIERLKREVEDWRNTACHEANKAEDLPFYQVGPPEIKW